MVSASANLRVSRAIKLDSCEKAPVSLFINGMLDGCALLSERLTIPSFFFLITDPDPWNQEDIVRRFPGETFEVELPKGGPRVGVTFRTGYHEYDVVIASINRDSPAGQTELKKVS